MKFITASLEYRIYPRKGTILINKFFLFCIIYSNFVVKWTSDERNLETSSKTSAVSLSLTGGYTFFLKNLWHRKQVNFKCISN